MTYIFKDSPRVIYALFIYFTFIGNLKEIDVFVCVLLAYGGPGYFYNRKGEKKSLSTIISKFRHCGKLLQKPKLFIVQVRVHY